MKIRNFLYKILSMIVQFLVSVWFTRLIVGTLSETANGYYVLSNDFVNYATVISVALNSMAIRYVTISYHKCNYKDTNRFFNTIFFGNIIISIILLPPITYLVFNIDRYISIPIFQVYDVKGLFLCVLLNFIFNLICSVFSITLITKNRIDLDSIRIIESNVIKLILVTFLFYFFTPKLWMVGISVFISSIYVFTRNYAYTKLYLPEVELFNLKYFSKKHIKELLSSGIWNSYTKIGAILLCGLDLLIANKFISIYYMGILSIIKIIPKYFLVSVGSITSVFTPEILISYAKNDITKVIRLITLSIKINSIIAIVFFVILVTMGKSLYVLWLPTQNSELLFMLTVFSSIGIAFVVPFEGIWTIFTATNRVKTSSVYLFLESILTVSTVFFLFCIYDDEYVRLLILTITSSAFEVIRGVLFLPISGACLLGVDRFVFYKSIRKVFCGFCYSIIPCLFISSVFTTDSWVAFCLLFFIVIAVSISASFLTIMDKSERDVLLLKFKNTFF